MTTRLKFSEFNPYAFLAHQSLSYAKPAKVAKLVVDNNQTLASLAPIAANQQKSVTVCTWNATDWQAYFDERAAIAEYDGGLSRTAAEQQAHDECVTRWMQFNLPAHDNPNSCLQCDKAHRREFFVSVINRDGNPIWVHNECLQPWMSSRRQAAARRLAHLKT